MTAATISEMVTLSPFGAGSRRVLVMGAEVGFGLARMFQIMRDPSPDEIHVFREGTRPSSGLVSPGMNSHCSRRSPRCRPCLPMRAVRRIEIIEWLSGRQS